MDVPSIEELENPEDAGGADDQVQLNFKILKSEANFPYK